MHIAIVTAHLSPMHSSNELDLARGLTNLGHRVSVITSNRPSRLSSNVDVAQKIVTDQELGGFQLIRLPALLEVRGTPYMLGLAEVLQKLKPNIIHCQEYYRVHSWQAYRASQTLGVPFVFTQHRYFYPSGIGGVVFWLGNSTLWRTIIGSASGITAVSNAAKQFLVLQFGLSDDGVEVVPHSVDTRRFRPAASDWIQRRLGIVGGPFIVSVGRLTRLKRIDVLIRVMPRIVREFPDAKLVVVGSGDQEPFLRQLISRSNLQRSVCLISKYVDYWRDMPGLYSSGDIFVLPTAQDVLPIAMLEAMASRLPVISTPVGGIPDFVSDGRNGYLVGVGDEEGLLDRLCELLADGDRRRDFGMRARQTVEERADMLVVAHRTLNVYERALETKRM